jgi:hypothetical protein
MQVNTTLIVLILSLFVSPVTGVYYIIRIVFNNGSPSSCTSTEWSKIDNAIFVLSQLQRKLGLKGNSSLNVTDTQFNDNEALDESKEKLQEAVTSGRELAYPNSCANSCAGFATRTCKALNCKGYRRREMRERKKRGLFWATDCNNQISELNNLMTNLRNTAGFTTKCKDYLALSRKYECFTDDLC